MSARQATTTVLLTAAIAATTASAALCGPWLPAPGEYYSEIRAGYFSSRDFHTRHGWRQPFAGGGVVQQRSALSYSEFGWKKNVSVMLGIPALSLTRRSGDGRLDRTETGLGDIQLGMRFQLAGGSMPLALQVVWVAPAGYDHRVRLTADSIAGLMARTGRGLTDGDSAQFIRQQAPPSLGYGQQEMTATVQWGTEIRRLNGFLEMSHGYCYRGPKIAGQALLGANLGLWLWPKVLVAGRYQGAITVGRGETRADEIEEHLAGPVMIYRVDDHLDVFAGSLHTATARNVLHADRYYVGVALKQTGLDRLQGFLGGTKHP